MLQVACSVTEGSATSIEQTPRSLSAAQCAYQVIKHLSNSVQLYSN